MKKLLFSALVLAGTLGFAKPSNNVSILETKNVTSEIIKKTELSVNNAELPWYTETTITTYWVLGHPVLVTTKTRIVWYSN